MENITFHGQNSTAENTGIANTTAPSVETWWMFVTESEDFSDPYLTPNPDIGLDVGVYSYSLVCPMYNTSGHDYGVILLRLYDESDNYLSTIGAWASQNQFDSMSTIPIASPHASPIRYESATHAIQITDFEYGYNGIFGSHDLASAYALGADGRSDMLAQITFEVTAIPEPATCALMSFVLSLGWLYKRFYSRI